MSSVVHRMIQFITKIQVKSTVDTHNAVLPDASLDFNQDLTATNSDPTLLKKLLMISTTEGERRFHRPVVSTRFCARYTVELIYKIYKGHIKRSLPFGALFNNISQRQVSTVPLLNPAFSSRSLRSTASDRRFLITFARIFPRIM